MNPEQKAAHEAFKILLADTTRADELYNSLPGSLGGKIVSTDLARYLDTRYRDIDSGKPRDLVPGWDLAWRYAQDRFGRELKDRRSREIVRFMAGGWAAGKTYALQHLEVPDLVWDGTLSDPQWASLMIDQAIRNRWKVDIAYVYRDMELALYGAVERAKQEGRSVPLKRLPAVHRSVQGSILHLIERYRTRPEVSFTLVHNVGIKGTVGISREIFYDHLAPRGALNYTANYEHYYGEAALEIESCNSA